MEQIYLITFEIKESLTTDEQIAISVLMNGREFDFCILRVDSIDTNFENRTKYLLERSCKTFDDLMQICFIRECHEKHFKKVVEKVRILNGEEIRN